jgi:hypothetical protein
MTIASAIEILSLLISLRPLPVPAPPGSLWRPARLAPSRRVWLAIINGAAASFKLSRRDRQNQLETPGGPRKPAAAKRLMGTKRC